MQMTCQDQLGTVMLSAKLEIVVPITCSDCCTDLSHVSQPVHCLKGSGAELVWKAHQSLDIEINNDQVIICWDCSWPRDV